MIEEERLIERAIQGDEAALTVLLETTGSIVRREVAPSIPSRWQSLLSEDDVMQQTYADAFRSISRFVPLGDGAFRAWLSSLAKCNLSDAVKMLEAEKRGGKHKKVIAAGSRSSYLDLFEVLSGSGTSPSRKVSRAEAATLVQQHVDALPEVYRTAVRMYDLEGRSVADVAVSLGRSPGAVHMLRARAHDRLRRAMGSEGDFFTDSP